jgi:subtilisin-like proprotein convertase family protein
MPRSSSRPLLLVLVLVLAAGALARPVPASAAATTVSSSTPITIPAEALVNEEGTASPYPSSIVVSGLSGVITDVNVTLNGVSHTYPLDLDLLLVGPGGQQVMLMSDVGGDMDISAVNLTFDDAAAALLATPVVSGTFQPTNLVGDDGHADALPAPAPAGPHGTTLSVFTGTAPNGTWSLFVVDDAPDDSGAITAGWSLTLTTTEGRPALSQLSPNRVPLTSTPQTITIRGSTFVDGATVTIGLKTYPATYVSSTELRISILPRDVFLAGWLVVPTVKVMVVNPSGVTSNSVTLYLAR